MTKRVPSNNESAYIHDGDKKLCPEILDSHVGDIVVEFLTVGEYNFVKMKYVIGNTCMR
ncbi:hypothetical protein GCM10010965_21310 [Caldalkalibacillus thermarum]|nr:hypothetical protein GCM10010965_21310 [Caldalkalibacillus thermarum]